MSIDIDVYTQLDDGALRGASTRLHSWGERTGRDVGRDLGDSMAREIERSTSDIVRKIEAVVDAGGRLRDVSGKFVSRDDAEVVNEFSAAALAAATAVNGVGGAAQSATSQIASMGDTLAGLGRFAGPIGIAALVPLIAGLGGAAASATGAIGLLPGVIGGAASAFGTLKLATLGFDEAMKNMDDPQKFAEALRQLAPAAQQAATTIQSSLMPAFDQLQRVTQQSFFAGVGPQLQQTVSALLPTVQQATTGIASAMNQMFMGVTNQLMTPETQASLQAFTSNITTAFNNLAPAMGPITQAFAQLSAVGSGVLPEIATAATQAATAFAQFIDQASRSGALQDWINRGLDMFRQLGPIIGDAVTAFMGLAPIGEQIMPMIADGMNIIAAVLPGISALVAEISPFFTIWEQGIRQAAAAIPLISAALRPVAEVVKAVASGLSFLMGPEFAAQANLNAARIDAAFNQSAAAPIALGGGANAQRERRGFDPVAPAPRGLVTTKPDGTTQDVAPYFDPSQWQIGAAPGTTSGAAAASTTSGVQWNPAENAYGTFEVDQNRVMSAQERLSEAQLRVLELKSEENVKQSTMVAAENNVLQAQRELAEAQQGTWKKMEDTAKGFSSGMQEIGASLDQDFGLSKGLPGLAENLVKFIGNLAAAPMMAQLDVLRQANEAQTGIQGGYGLLGIMGAQNLAEGRSPLLGNPLPPDTYASSSSGYSPSALGPAAWQPTAMPGAPQSGESARAFAHRVMMPFWQSQGFEVGDHAADKYGEHQNGALDIMVPSIAAGQKVLQQVLSDPNVYGAIFNNQTYGYGHGMTPRDYSAGHTGNPTQDHQDHVHAWYKPGGGGGGGLGSPEAAAMALPTVSISPAATASAGGASPFSGIPVPLPVTIVGGLGTGIGGGLPLPGAPGSPVVGGAPLGTPASGVGLGPPPGPVGGAPGTTWAGPLGVPAYSGQSAGALPSMGIGTGLGTVPGAGAAGGPAAGATQIGGVAPPQGTGKGGVGISEGGSLDTAMSLAASAFPGVGQAAQTGMKLASRAIQFAGQAAGIGVEGLMQTFLPTGGSELASRGWAQRIIGGLAGAGAAIPNVAGKSAAAAGQQGQPGQHQGTGAPPGPPPVQVNYTANNQTEDRNGADLTYHLGQMYSK